MTDFPFETYLPQELDRQGVYAIKHVASGKVYIGSSVNIRHRLQQHWKMLMKGTHHSSHLQRAWNKYSHSEFVVSIVEIVERKQDLVEREQFWIEHFSAFTKGFNGRPKAESVAGIKWSDEQNEARRESNKRAWADPALRESLSRKFSGKRRGKWTATSHAKSSQSLRQRHRDDPEWRNKLKRALDDPANSEKRVSGIRRSLKKPEVYSARVRQLRDASASPKRINNLRQTAFEKHNLQLKGISSDQELDERCISLYKSGYSLRQIGRTFGIDHKSIAARLRRHGIEIERRYAAGNQIRGAKLNDDNIRDIRKLLSNGFTNHEIAKKYGVSESVISEIRNGKSWKHVK